MHGSQVVNVDMYFNRLAMFAVEKKFIRFNGNSDMIFYTNFMLLNTNQV